MFQAPVLLCQFRYKCHNTETIRWRETFGNPSTRTNILNTLSFDTAFSNLKKLTDDLSITLPFSGLKDQLRKLSLPRFEWPALKIGNLTASVPVVQGGMGVGISLSGLASAMPGRRLTESSE